MDTLCALVQQLRRRYALFMPTVNKVLLRHGIQSVEYDQLISTHVLVSSRLSSTYPVVCTMIIVEFEYLGGKQRPMETIFPPLSKKFTMGFHSSLKYIKLYHG